VNPHDEHFMRRALELAGRAVGLASPNPPVGCVLVKDGAVVGEGFHQYDLRDHAEVFALKQAGAKARGATAYVTLEPCNSTGRTGPCSEALIAAGVARVVAAMEDPNPKTNGAGLDRLRAARISVDAGVLEPEAQRLNEAFAKFIVSREPFVTLKSALTLDGQLALAPARKKKTRRSWITGEESRAEVQRMRHSSDALFTGIGTILADDPLLTDRSGNPRRRSLLRVILDSQLRLPLDSRVVRSAQNDVLVVCSSAEEEKKRELEARGVRVEQVAQAPDGRPDIHAIVRRLGELEITSVMIEGGSAVNAMALASGVVDKIFLYYAPTIMASAESVPFAAGTGLGHQHEAMRLEHVQLHHFGEDVAVEGYLRDPYEG
jgi:diaminohydroxyphosphoribosylaminopyrimidine deaminase / 5-amino-6-(5-phosphoribosylamino)uracil reductase